jgi:hypothetical protein
LQGWTQKRKIKVTAKKDEGARQFNIQLEVEKRTKEKGANQHRWRA